MNEGNNYMIFNGMLKIETLFFNLESDVNQICFIEMEKDCDEDVFYVRSSHDDKWEWKFSDEKCNYELVKHAIFDIAFDSYDIESLIEGLDEVFEDTFYDIVVFDCCGNGGCTNCTCKK